MLLQRLLIGISWRALMGLNSWWNDDRESNAEYLWSGPTFVLVLLSFPTTVTCDFACRVESRADS